MSSQFFLVLLVVMIFGAVEVYIYYRHVIEALDEPVTGNPFRVNNQYDRYVTQMDEQSISHWFMPLARHHRLVSAIVWAVVIGSVFYELFVT